MTDALTATYETSGTFYRDVAELLNRQLAQDPSRKDLQNFLKEVRDEMGVAGVNQTPLANQGAPNTRTRLGEGATYKPYFDALGQEYSALATDARFLNEVDLALVHYTGRPTSMFHADRLSQHYGGAQLYFKREDLAAERSHLTMALMGQAMTARRLGRKTLVGSSVKGYGGVMVASIAARLGLAATIYMHPEDIKQQTDNVYRMKLMGALVLPIHTSQYDGKDIRRAALDHCLSSPTKTFFVSGLDALPHPYPSMLRDFTSVVGREALRQVRAHRKVSPSVVVARGTEFADALGLFPVFLGMTDTRLVCVDTAVDHTITGERQRDAEARRQREAELAKKVVTFMERLDYPSVTREHAWFRATGRVDYVTATQSQVKRAIFQMSHLEGLTPALRTGQVVAWAGECAATLPKDQAVLVLLAENADKDIWEIASLIPVD